MPDTILLTGGTGFLGTEIASSLIDKDAKVYVLVRASSYEAACHRLRQAWDHDSRSKGHTPRSITSVKSVRSRCDYTAKGNGIPADTYHHGTRKENSFITVVVELILFLYNKSVIRKIHINEETSYVRQTQEQGAS